MPPLVPCRGEGPRRRATTDPVEKHFAVPERTRPRRLAGDVRLVADEFPLQTAKRALDRGVVPALARPAHAAHHPVSATFRPVAVAGVPAAPVRAGDRARRDAPLSHGRVRRVGDRPTGHGGGHRPPRDPPRERIRHEGEEPPPVEPRDRWGVRRPRGVRPRRREVPARHALGRRHDEPLDRLRPDAVASHHLRHRADAAGEAPRVPSDGRAGTAVPPLHLGVDLLDVSGRRLAASPSGRFLRA
jgi:hypothetical protein